MPMRARSPEFADPPEKLIASSHTPQLHDGKAVAFHKTPPTYIPERKERITYIAQEDMG